MPYSDQRVAPVAEPLPSDEQRKILTGDDPWSDLRAKQIVQSDFAHAEYFRTHNYDWRYRNASELYLAWQPQRFWDGTRVPRSSIGIWVVFEQVESMLPKTVASLASTDNFHFYATHPGEDTALPVLAWRELVLNQLQESNFREQVRRAVKSALIYGNGVLEVGVEEYEDEIIEFEKTVRTTKMMAVPHPTVGVVPVPTQQKESFRRKIVKETKTRPYVRNVSLIDFYVDPNAESISLQSAGFVIKRQYMRASLLKSLRDTEGFNIPDDATLAQMSMAKTTANQDVTKMSTELFRYNFWNPAQDYTADPSQKRIEVLEYTTKDRKIWMLGREHVIYNQPNRYGMINYFAATYADVLDRWHGLSVSDVAEGDQRLQVNITNGRIDELALALHPPVYKRRGVTIPSYQLRRRPGVLIETENPEGDIKREEVQVVTQSAYIEAQASEQRVQRITGMSDLAALGTPSSGGNSANRTATGVNTQLGATQDRVKYLVENFEDQLIEPVVNAVIKFDRKFMDPQVASNWLKIDPRFKDLDPEDVMNLQVTAECRGAIRMGARSGFLQVFPTLAQTYLNPELLQLLGQQQKKTINAEEIMAMLLDAINYTPRNPLIVEMSQEQQQAMQQPPAEAKLKMAMAQSKNQSTESINDKRLITKLLETVLKGSFDSHQKYAELDDKHHQFSAQLLTDLLTQIQQQNQPDQGSGDGGGMGEDSGSGGAF